jgi:hypothetical protein
MTEHEITNQIRELIEAEAEPVTLEEVGRRVKDHGAHRSRIWVFAVAAAILILGGVGVGVLRATDDSIEVTNPPPADEPSTPTPSTAPAAKDWAQRDLVESTGGIEILPPLPDISLSSGAAVVWTGTELVVWSGRDDAVVYSAESRAWRAISAAPLPPRPTTPPAGAMTDRGVLIAASTQLALWDPETDVWAELEPAPRPVHDLIVEGDLVLSYSAMAKLDLGTGEWRSLPEQPIEIARPTTAWTGEELIVVGGPGDPFTTAVGIAYDPATDRWRELPAPPSDLRAEALSADWDGERVVVVNYDMRAVALDPANGTWSDLPEVPAMFGEWTPTLRATGGTSIAFMSAGPVVLTDDDRWVPFPNHPVERSAFAKRWADATASDRPMVATIGTDPETGDTVVVAFDLRRMVDEQQRVQVGAVHLDVPGQYRTTAAAYQVGHDVESLAVELVGPRQGRCTATFTNRWEPPDDEAVTVELDHDGTLLRWTHSPDRRTWQAVVPSGILRLSCDDPDISRGLAQSTRGYLNGD